MPRRLFNVGEPVEIMVLLEGGAEPNRPDLPPVSVMARIIDSEGNQLGVAMPPTVSKREITLNVPPELVQVPGNYSAVFTIKTGEKPPRDTPVWFTVEGDVVPKKQLDDKSKQLKRTEREYRRTQKALDAEAERSRAESEAAQKHAADAAISEELLRKLQRALKGASVQIDKRLGK